MEGDTNDLSNLPLGVISKIAGLLEVRDLIALSSTCWNCRALLEEESCWEGSRAGLVYRGVEVGQCSHELVKQSYMQWRRILEGSCCNSGRRCLGEAATKGESALAAAAKRLDVEFGNMPPTKVLQELEGVVFFADTYEMVILGPQAAPLKFCIPLNSRQQFNIHFYMFSPHAALRYLTHSSQVVHEPSRPRSFFGSLRQIFLDFQPKQPSVIWRGGSSLFPSISQQSTVPNATVASLLGMEWRDIRSLKQLLGDGRVLDVLDISHYVGPEEEILGLLHLQSNLSSLIAQHTDIGSKCFTMLGTSLEFPGAKLKKLDIAGCVLRKSATTALVSCLRKMVHLEVLGLSGTETGALFDNAEDSGLTKVLQRLIYLDMSHVCGLTPNGLAIVLTCSPKLKTLICHGCVLHHKSTAVESSSHHSSSVGMNLANVHNAWKEKFCSFHKLSCGWGFHGILLKATWKASPWLVSFRCSIGAAMSDCALGALAKSCCCLQELALDSCPVSGQGVARVLNGCPWLHTLQLLRCVGPFDDGMVADISGVHHVSMREVCIVWGGGGLTDEGLGKLIGMKKPSLEHLELVGCRRLTDDLLNRILRVHIPVLRVLRLEECNQGPSSGLGSFSPAALENLIHFSTIRQLRLRHSCTADSNFVQNLVRNCPELELLLVDECDVSLGGKNVDVQPFGKLRYLQVAQCKVTKPWVQSIGTEVQFPGALSARRMDGQILIHDLLRSLPNFVCKN